VICEIMNEDGTMSRLPELIKFAQYHGMKIGAIADLIAYRRRFDRTIERIVETELNSRFGGDFRMIIFGSTLEGTEHVALVKGDVEGDAPVMVRMHAVNILEDLLGDHHRQRGGGLQQAMEMIGAAERGVVVLIRETRATNLSERIAAEIGAKADGGDGGQLRDYGVGAQILLDLGVKNLILLTNSPKRVVGIEGYGLNIVETLEVDHNTVRGN
jgi:3,4-dihydroxy 2-butanone 4-phosphate synthase/GTP cyclohydrolase II